MLADLATTDRARLQAALVVLEAKPEARAVGPLVARIREGLPPDLLQSAVRALGKSRGTTSALALKDLLSHRRPQVRKAAAEALGAQGARAQGPALLPLLDDADAQVRAAALAALGALGERRALEPAFAAVEAGDPAAMVCIAQLVKPTDLERLLALAARRPFAEVQPAFELILGRKDLPMRAKFDLVARIGALGTPPAQAYLRDYLTRVPEPGKKPMMAAIGKALQASYEVQTGVAPSPASPAAAPKAAAAPASPSKPAPAPTAPTATGTAKATEGKP